VKAQDEGVKEGFLTKHPSVDTKRRGRLGGAEKVPEEVSIQGSLNGNLLVYRRG